MAELELIIVSTAGGRKSSLVDLPQDLLRRIVLFCSEKAALTAETAGRATELFVRIWKTLPNRTPVQKAWRTTQSLGY
jgi:hypothetical protein